MDVLEGIELLTAWGVEYVYFIDDIFLRNQEMLSGMVNRPVMFGVQTRPDLWKDADIEPLGRAGCVSIEAGVESFRRQTIAAGVWANEPVPLFPYPGSPDYTRRWGAPDNRAWERAADCYPSMFDQLSDIQERRPVPLDALECEEGTRS